MKSLLFLAILSTPLFLKNLYNYYLVCCPININPIMINAIAIRHKRTQPNQAKQIRGKVRTAEKHPALSPAAHGIISVNK